MTDSTLLDPKNDFVFKKLFADAPDLLAALINAIRSDEVPITVVEVLNPRIDFIALDLLAEDIEGRRYNVEMQVRRYNAWSARSAYYLARTLTGQLKSGEDYQSLKPVIGIHLLDFELFEAPDQAAQALWCFELRDRRQPHVTLGNELQLNLIELPKADRLGLAQPALRAWVGFFEHWQEERTMAAIAYAPVQQALEHIKALSADAETQRLAFVRERALHDEVSELRAEREKGRREGMLEVALKGKLEGQREGLETALARLMQSGMSEDQARQLLGL
ncbi:Rpn family recombination-promoting nuclease/putative transposase [uncultured Thiodictyon sp.]|uniref:Rpn family recombination-promoting nuclease/putative transposase n=1 Tax=uncultured Thiodictyon sp. TaxID=1846217 RepID=UPI0025F2764A|nr:Rpn family recombination-promoting nuclease/putative transposase [uncultured Thiodictyon sp.]